MDAKMVFFSLLLGSLMAGCSSSKSYHVSKDYKCEAQKLKKVGVVIARAEILNLSVSGDALPDIEKSAQSQKLFESAVVNELSRKGYSAVLLDIDDDLRVLIKEYENIRPYMLHLYSRNIITGNPMANSDNEGIDTIPNLKSTVPVLTKAGVDAIGIIWAVDNISTVGRKAWMAAMAVINIPVPHGETYAELALLDKSGKLVFYNLKKGRNYNLTKADSVSSFSSVLVDDLVATQQ